MLVAVSAPLVMPLHDSDIPMNVPFTSQNTHSREHMPEGNPVIKTSPLGVMPNEMPPPTAEKIASVGDWLGVCNYVELIDTILTDVEGVD
jgi:hypothetical protein